MILSYLDHSLRALLVRMPLPDWLIPPVMCSPCFWLRWQWPNCLLFNSAVVTLIGSLTISFRGFFAAVGTSVRARLGLLNVACVAVVGDATGDRRLVGMAVAGAGKGDLTGVIVASLIWAGSRRFLGVGPGFGARISGPNRSNWPIT